jgi:K+ transporter
MHERSARQPGSIAALGFASLGVVFGDIGTSPLYTLKTVLDLTGGSAPAAALGVLSLIVWTLIAITSVKYVTIAMRIDNDGEGGILALMAMLGVKRQKRPAIVALGLFGAALIYGDGAITPAISVLSALEGLTIAAPGPDMQISRIRLSDKTSRLHPRHVVPKSAQAYEPEVGGGLRADLCRPGELAVDGRHHRADSRLRQIR